MTALKADLTDTASEVIGLSSVSDMTGKKAYYNTTYNRIAYNNNQYQQFNVFSVDAGDVVEIRGYGNNTEAGAFAMVGNADIVSTGAIYCGLLQVIAPDSSNVSFHTVTATIEQAGYLYVNGTSSTAGTVKKTISVTVIKTDKTLTNPSLPANSASVGEAIYGKGVYISNGNYYHFTRDGGTNIIRVFLRRGINNLFQWNQVMLGEVDAEGIHAETSYTGFGTDIVGPISIWNGTLWPNKYGVWAGGNHGRSVEGVEYPTAEQLSFKCLVNGAEVSQDGLYFGDVRFITENKIYFPQSITGADLSTATPAIIEHRSYFMNGGKMNVKVRLEFVEDVRISHYYGMQAVDHFFNTVFCVNNDFYATFSSISEVTHLSEQEHKIIFERNDNGLHMDMSLDELGLGTYKLNDASVGYVTFPAHATGGIPKTYYDLISKTSNPSIPSGANLFWEGTYDMYFS